jgi:hypothetical protein
MAVELPEPLQWVLLLLAGTRWPEADEDMLREMARRWRDGARTLEDAGKSADSAVKRALDGQKGVAAEALATHWAQFTTGKGTEQDPGYFPGLVQACDGMGDMLEAMANSAETAKIQIIAQLGILAFEIATAEAEAPFTAGVSLAEIPVFVGVSRTVVQQILKKLLKEALEFAAKQAAQMAAINVLAQGIEVMEGHRKSIDMKEVGQNALGGAVAGASGHLIGKGLSGAGSKLGLSSVMETTAGKMVHGAAVGVGADVSTQLITTGHVDGGSLLGSGLSGGASVGLRAGASAVKGHFNGPPTIPSPHGGPSGGAAGSGSGAGAGAGSPSGLGHGSDTPVFSKPDSATSGYQGPGGGSSTGGGSSAGGSSAGGGAHGADSPVGGAGHETAGSSRGTGTDGFGSPASGARPSGGDGPMSGGTPHESTAGRTESGAAPAASPHGLVPFGSDRPTAPAEHATAGASEHGPVAESPVHSAERPAATATGTEPTAPRSEAPASTDTQTAGPVRSGTADHVTPTPTPEPAPAEHRSADQQAPPTAQPVAQHQPSETVAAAPHGAEGEAHTAPVDHTAPAGRPAGAGAARPHHGRGHRRPSRHRRRSGAREPPGRLRADRPARIRPGLRRPRPREHGNPSGGPSRPRDSRGPAAGHHGPRRSRGPAHRGTRTRACTRTGRPRSGARSRGRHGSPGRRTGPPRAGAGREHRPGGAAARHAERAGGGARTGARRVRLPRAARVRRCRRPRRLPVRVEHPERAERAGDRDESARHRGAAHGPVRADRASRLDRALLAADRPGGHPAPAAGVPGRRAHGGRARCPRWCGPDADGGRAARLAAVGPPSVGADDGRRTGVPARG